MPSLEAQPSGYVKLLLLGDSGTGKTGALASLVKANLSLRVFDFDNKLAGGILPILLSRDCPHLLKNVEYEVFRDNFKGSPIGPILDGAPQAYTKALAFMDKWSDGSIPKKWGPDYVLVMDSLTFFSDSAFNWAKSLNPTAKDMRNTYFVAQQGVEKVIGILTSAAFEAHVIVISHVDWENRPDGTMKGYPSSVGKALGPTLPAYFENMALCQTVAGKRTIRTAPTALVDLKNPAAFKMAQEMPIETGLATFFQTLRG